MSYRVASGSGEHGRPTKHAITVPCSGTMSLWSEVSKQHMKAARPFESSGASSFLTARAYRPINGARQPEELSWYLLGPIRYGSVRRDPLASSDHE